MCYREYNMCIETQFPEHHIHPHTSMSVIGKTLDAIDYFGVTAID